MRPMGDMALVVMVVASTAGAATNFVTWTDLVHVQVDGGILRKNLASALWDSGAASVQRIDADTHGYAEATVAGPFGNRIFGLSTDNTNASFNTIDFGMYLYTGGLIIYEHGVNLGTFGSWTNDDILRIERVGSTVRYMVNGQTRYTSTQQTTASLRVDTSFLTNGTELHNVNLGTLPIPEPASAALLGFLGLAALRRGR